MQLFSLFARDLAVDAGVGVWLDVMQRLHKECDCSSWKFLQKEGGIRQD